MKGSLAILSLIVALGLCLSVRAADVSANAALTRTTVGVGEPTQLQIQLTGTRNSGNPPNISVDGLAIQYIGQSTQMQMNNFTDVTVSVTHNYQVVPTRAGTFTIPAIAIDVDGKHLKTQPIALKVQQGNPGAARGGGGAQSNERMSFAEIILPKRTAYVGEAIPAELRLYVDDRLRWSIQSMPDFDGEGFTKSKLTQPRQESARRDGRAFNVLVCRTAITPSKAGKISIGPAEFTFVAQVPRGKRNRSGSIFDMFDDMFTDPVFATNQQMTAKADAVTLEVKPLPANGRPKDFSGAVGDFKFTADASPRDVNVGDPVTMKLQISGHGSFDRVEAPVMVDAGGWRTYPAQGNLKADDEAGTSGTKTFEMAVIPESRKNATPVFQFSYFDPAAEKYVTLKSAPTPLTMHGEAPQPPPAHAAVANEVQPSPQPPPPAPAPTDILGLHYEFGTARDASAPLYLRREFLLAQLVPMCGVLALIGRRVMKRSDSSRKVEALRHERNDLLKRMRSTKTHSEFFDHAARVIQLDTALATGRPPGSVDANAAHWSRQLDDATRDAVERIFNARAELHYAGGGGGDERISDAERRSVLQTIEQFERANASA